MGNKYLTAIITILIILIFPMNILAMQVNPMVINMLLEPGDMEEFQIELTGAIVRDTFQLYLMNTVQNIDGTLRYEDAASITNPVLDWIEIDTNEVTIPANEKATITGRVRVPFDASGSHTAVIMVQQSEAVSRPESFMNIRMRYAIRINIDINRPGQIARVEIIDFDLTANDNGNPVITTHFRNTTPLSFPAVADVTIRGEDRRLLERVPVFSKATNLARRDHFRVYPNSELIFQGEVSEQLFPGTYELQLFLRYADGRQAIQRKTVEIGDEFLREETIRYLTLEPENMTLSLRPGASSIQVLQLNNRTNEPIIVRTRPLDIRTDYPYSILSSLEIELRGDTDMQIQPRGTGRQLLNFKTARDLEPAGYYGRYEVEVYNQFGETLETHLIDLSAIVGTDLTKIGEILDLNHNQNIHEHLFSLTVRNNGNIHLAPTASLQLIDETGQVYTNLNLELEEDRILPENIGRLMVERNRIIPGVYTGIISLIDADGNELDTKEFSINVIDPEQDVSLN